MERSVRSGEDEPRVLRGLLVSESFAYGFTIAFWGVGLSLINEYDTLHTLGILEDAGGGVTGFGGLAVATFGSPIDTSELGSPPPYHVLAAIHYVASVVPIGVAHFVLAAGLGEAVTLFLAGAVLSACYNVAAAFEELLSEAVWTLEQRYEGG